jgi:hypothetical protein
MKEAGHFCFEVIFLHYIFNSYAKIELEKSAADRFSCNSNISFHENSFACSRVIALRLTDIIRQR